MHIRLAAFAVVFALLAVACTSDSGNSSPLATSEPATTQPQPDSGEPGSVPTAAAPSVSSTTTPSGPTRATITTEASPELEQAVNDLIAITEDVRGLRFLRSPLVTVVSDEELAQRVAELIDEELEPDDIARDDSLYEALGIIEPAVDLEKLFVDLYSEQVAGYYDGDEEELVVPASDGDLTPLQKLTLVHELTHSLTDQHFEFNEVSNELTDNQRFEEADALSALLEGDATMTELLYFQRRMSASEQQAVLEESITIDTSVLDATPSFIADSLIWPYDLAGGAGFVMSLWQENGDFSAVNDAYARFPTTTEQVADPDRYRAGEDGIAVDLAPTPVEGYEVGEESSWGQQGYEALFDQAIDSATSSAAAEGWGGDTYRVLWNGSEIVFVNLFVGDTEQDAEEMELAWTTFGTAQVPNDRYVFVGRDGEEVLVIVADSQAAGEAALDPYRSEFSG